jgi:hypothetical protein
MAGMNNSVKLIATDVTLIEAINICSANTYVLQVLQQYDDAKTAKGGSAMWGMWYGHML